MTTIYISSTFEDLKEHRRAVFDALRKSGYAVIAMEDYVATDQRPLEACLRDIGDRADIYIGIFAFRYGYIPPEEHLRACDYTAQHEDWRGSSITELELRYAKDEACLPCLTFLVKDGTPWNPDYIDAYAERQMERPGDRIDRLRKYLLKEKLASQFSSPYELASLVQAAVAKHLQTSAKASVGKIPSVPAIKWDIERDGSPYPGLMHFTPKFATVFFGRELEVQEIIERIHSQKVRFILVSGDSGVGKSSVIDAGVLPKLEESGLPGGRGCICVRMVPSQGSHPFDALIRPLHSQAQQAGFDSYTLGEQLRNNPTELSAHLGKIIAKGTDKDALVLFLDQMEELFTSQASEHADAFVTALCQATQNEALWVIATIRSDHLHHCHHHPDMLEVMRGHGHYPLGQVDPTVIVDMIKKPAQCAGLDITDRFVRRIALESGSEPGSLPLLAFALQRLFDKRVDCTLSEQVYESFGGVDGAVMVHVKTFEHKLRREMGNAVDDLLPKLFQALLVVDPGGSPTRRRALLDGFGDNLALLVDSLIKARLLSTEGEGVDSTVSVAHERLFEVWPTLSHWIAENQDDLRMLNQAETEAREWEKHNHDLIYLWHVNRLKKLQEIVYCLDGPAISHKIRSFAKPQKLLVELLESPTLSHQERLKIGLYLSELGDLRPGVGLREDGLPNIVWCKVPEGQITLEKEDGTFQVESFSVAKYPVTWIQYRSFLEAEDGYQNQQWWEGLAERKNEPGKQYHEFDNHPAENVSWYDAVAFCRWLTERMNCEIKIQLPTEWEWQQAATGGDPDNKYPWGAEWDSDRTNTIESRLNRTTAVGLYPHGVSPVEAFDMSGNVWEWCLNERENPLMVEMTGDGRRVLRGLSWIDSQRLVHRDHRIGSNPDLRKNYVGFRVCCVSLNL